MIVHPNAKPPTRDPGLRYLNNRGPNLPALSDEGIVHLDPFSREVFAELPVGQCPADFSFPPTDIFDGEGVDRLVGPSVCQSIRLVVSGKVDTSDCDPAGDG
jgi:hypothetical protein